MEQFLSRFRELLADSDKTQTEICNEIGITKQRLSNWKSGYTEPNQSDMVMLADYFQVSLDYLLGRSDDFGNVSVRAEKVGEFLSDDEKKILNTYRNLPYPWKIRVQTYIDVAEEMNAEENNNKKNG